LSVFRELISNFGTPCDDRTMKIPIKSVVIALCPPYNLVKRQSILLIEVLDDLRSAIVWEVGV
jgi:hypothetical protein